MPEMSPKMDRRIVRSRTALKEALLKLMAQKPFTSISITEIVELANYNRGTFYFNFESKDALLDEILGDLIHNLTMSFRSPYEKAEVFRINDIHAQSVMIFEHVYRNAAVYTALMKSDALSKLKDKMFAALKQISMEEIVYPDDGVDHELFTIYNLHALLGLVFHWVESGFRHTPAYMQEQLVKLVTTRPAGAAILRADE